MHCPQNVEDLLYRLEGAALVGAPDMPLSEACKQWSRHPDLRHAPEMREHLADAAGYLRSGNRAQLTLACRTLRYLYSEN